MSTSIQLLNQLLSQESGIGTAFPETITGGVGPTGATGSYQSGEVFLGEQKLTATGTFLEYTNIPQTYRHLRVRANFRTSNAAVTLTLGSLTLNNLSAGTSYVMNQILTLSMLFSHKTSGQIYSVSSSSGFTTSIWSMFPGNGINFSGHFDLIFPNYAVTGVRIGYGRDESGIASHRASGGFQMYTSYYASQTAPITSIKFTGNGFGSGLHPGSTIQIFGIR